MCALTLPPTHTQVTSLGYKDLVTFHSHDKRGKPVYHTNVMMAIGTDVAVVCGESVTDDKERQHLMVSSRGGAGCRIRVRACRQACMRAAAAVQHACSGR
jgi:hypothetical protein